MSHIEPKQVQNQEASCRLPVAHLSLLWAARESASGVPMKLNCSTPCGETMEISEDEVVSHC